MNATIGSFRFFLGQIRDGDAQATTELLTRYGPDLLKIVRRRLSPRLRSKFDSTDFVQSTWASFFRRADCLREFGGPSDLRHFLLAIARNKVSDEVRRNLTSGKRDIRRERSLESADGETEPRLTELPDTRQSPPAETAVAREIWQRLVAGQPELHRRVVELRFQGATFEEIAAALSIHERTARKIVQRVVRNWNQEDAP